MPWASRSPVRTSSAAMPFGVRRRIPSVSIASCSSGLKKFRLPKAPRHDAVRTSCRPGSIVTTDREQVSPCPLVGGPQAAAPCQSPPERKQLRTPRS